MRRGEGERGWEGGNEELLRSREGGEDLKKLQKAKDGAETREGEGRDPGGCGIAEREAENRREG